MIKHGFAGAVFLLLLILFSWHYLNVRDAVLNSGDTFLYRGYFFLGAAGFVLCAVSYYLLQIRKSALRTVFAICILFLGLGNIFVFKGLSAPDEVSHYITAYKLSNAILMQEQSDEQGRVYVRSADMYLEDMENRIELVKEAREKGDDTVDSELKIFGQKLDESIYDIYASGDPAAAYDKNAVSVSCQWTVNTIPFAYIPQALGITLARLLGFGPLGLITLGKIFNLLFFAGMTMLAMSLLPAGGELIMAAAMLPMSIHLAGSMSYDVYVMSMSFVYIALVMRLKEKKDEIGWKELILPALLLALLGPCKIVYSLLILLLLTLLQPGEGKWSKKLRTFLILGVLSVVLLSISMYLVNHQTLNDYASADERIITWAEEPEGYTVSYLIHRPIELIRIFYNSFMMMSGNWFATMFGLYLGNQDPVLNVPYPVIGIFAAGLFLLAAGSGVKLDIFSKAVAVCVFFAVLGALMGSMLIAYTPMSSPYIAGVQGRYLLPVLPLILLSIPGEWIRLKRPLTGEIFWLFTVLDVYVLLRIYATVCLRIG